MANVKADTTYDVYKHKRYIGTYVRSDLRQMGIPTGRLEQDIKRGTEFEGGYTVKPERTEKARQAAKSDKQVVHVPPVKCSSGCRFGW